jgi:hypothetical protein
VVGTDSDGDSDDEPVEAEAAAEGEAAAAKQGISFGRPTLAVEDDEYARGSLGATPTTVGPFCPPPPCTH